jgi:DNA-binding response OmpR family regulator
MFQNTSASNVYISSGDNNGTPASVGLDLDAIARTPYRPRVLIVDDDLDMVLLLKQILRQAGFDVAGAFTGNEAITKCSAANPDVILLDLMMPEMDGWAIYQDLRKITDAPVMIVSAISNKDSVVRGLQIGADDYLTKPFYNAEVVARVVNIMRRTGPRTAHKAYYFPEIKLRLDLETRSVQLRDQSIQLSAKEFAVLELLAKQAPSMVPYKKIAMEVWGIDNPEVRKRIKYLIFLLRRKLEADPGNPTMIVTVERVGYRLQTHSD